MSQENKKIVEEINRSFTEGDTDGFLSHCAEDITWTMYGDRTVNGKAAIKEWMKSMDGMEPPQFTVDYLLADRNAVMASGTMSMKDKEGKTAPYAYCDIYRFSGGKVTEMRTFAVNTAKADRSASA